MREYFRERAGVDSPELISAIDDLPLWSAPFGLSILDTIEVRKGLRVLDIGCGAGFPLIEIAQRLGDSCRVFGIDPWSACLERVRAKLKVYDIRNVRLHEGRAEEMPYADGFFDLIVSCNGINNVEDAGLVLKECFRVSRKGAQLVISVNLDKTMIEFYKVFREVLEERGMKEELRKMEAQIYSKRKPLDETVGILKDSGFMIRNTSHDSFEMAYADGTAMLNHFLIRYWFLDGWKDILPPESVDDVFGETERRMNERAEREGRFVLTVPFVTIDCRRK